MKTQKFDITVELCAPVLTKSSTPGKHGIDAAMARGSFRQSDGSVTESWYLPGTHLKGLLRESWQELAAVDSEFGRWNVKWLGETPPPDDIEDGPGQYEETDRGRLFFDDLVLAGKPKDGALRYRIALDELRGAADRGKLAVLESPFAPGTPLKFKGSIRLTCPDNFDPKPLQKAIRTGLRWIRAAGAMRSTGFGTLLSATVPQLTPIRKRERDEVEPRMPDSKTWLLRLSFDRPICFARRRIGGNLFESEEFVPGGAIKAAIGAMIAGQGNVYQALRIALHKVRFTHAQPADGVGEGANQWPLSLIAFGKSFEEAIHSQTCFTREGKAGKFDIDWKERDEWEIVRQAYGHPRIEREIRIRTAIEGETRAAAENELFAAETLLPFGITWSGEANTEGLSREAREQLFEVLRCGLQPMGKTKAYADLSISNAPSRALPTAANYAVTLTSAALLVDPSGHLSQKADLPGSQRASDMAAAYQDAWRQLSLGTLRLERFFHRVYLAGGLYFRRRFQRVSGPATGYKPYLMTSAGSSFLLTPVPGKENEAHSLLEGWINNGLPLTESVKVFYGIAGVAPEDLWRRCPWLPENGYGGVTVNQPMPAALSSGVTKGAN
jgi:hypothetical protein